MKKINNWQQSPRVSGRERHLELVISEFKARIKNMPKMPTIPEEEEQSIGNTTVNSMEALPKFKTLKRTASFDCLSETVKRQKFESV